MPEPKLYSNVRKTVSKIAAKQSISTSEIERNNIRYWIGQRGIIGIEFDQKRNVKSRVFQAMEPDDFLDRFRDWLGV